MGSLRLPSSYVDVDSNEMQYIDGGWTFNVMTVGVAGAIFNTAIGIVVGGAGAGAISAYIARVGAREAAKIFTRTLVTKLTAIGCAALAASIGPIVTTVLNYLDIGTAIARKLDAIDAKPNNGWLTIGF